jgi:hypothetical protein
MVEAIIGRLDQLSNAFCRIADRAPLVRARFSVNGGRFGFFVLGPPCEDGSDEGMVHGSRRTEDFAIISELYALTDQAGTLFAELWQSGRYQGKFSSPVSIHYDLQLPREPWLMVLLHKAPVFFHCKTSNTAKGLNLAWTELGKGEVVVWIDNYAQVCVSALAWLKANSLADPSTIPATSPPAEVSDAGKSPKPRWDPRAQQLWLGDNVVRTFRRRAPAQFEILDAFEKADWATSVRAPSRRFSLKDAVDALNDELVSSRLKFLREDNDTKIRWRITPV